MVYRTAHNSHRLRHVTHSAHLQVRLRASLRVEEATMSLIEELAHVKPRTDGRTAWERSEGCRPGPMGEDTAVERLEDYTNGCIWIKEGHARAPKLTKR